MATAEGTLVRPWAGRDDSQCVFMYWARDNEGNKTELMGVLAVHVDDIIIAGTVTFEAVITRMKGKLSFRKRM